MHTHSYDDAAAAAAAAVDDDDDMQAEIGHVNI